MIIYGLYLQKENLFRITGVVDVSKSITITITTKVTTKIIKVTITTSIAVKTCFI